MADTDYPPGSRAIKIPLSRLKHDSYTTPSRRRSDRDDSMQRAGSTGGSSSDAASSSASPSSSRTRDTVLLNTSKTIVSPSGTQSHNTSVYPALEQPAPQRKDKQRASDALPPNTVHSIARAFSHSSPLSPSMLGSSSYKSVNLSSRMADPDEPPRIITYTKHSQGFTWNDELFLPSYLVGRRYRSSQARRRRGGGYDEDEEMGEADDVPFDEEADRCPVMDIFVTDEEAAAMLP